MLHFTEIQSRKDGRCTTYTIDGYTTRKTVLGAVHEIGREIAKIDADEANFWIGSKTEAEAKQLLAKNDGAGFYCFELEEVCCASRLDDETGEVEYADGNYYFLVRFFVWETEETETEETETEETETEETETEETEAETAADTRFDVSAAKIAETIAYYQSENDILKCMLAACDCEKDRDDIRHDIAKNAGFIRSLQGVTA